MNWDDLRIAMAVHRCGSFAKAAARLRVDESTVARRLNRLQRDLGLPLFEAVDGKRLPTAACKEILARVEQIARQVEQIAEVPAARQGLVGRCRIAATDSIAVEVLGPRAAGFLADNPGLTLQLLTSTENVDFSRWQADLAIRLQQPEKGDFTITKLAAMRLLLIEPADAAPHTAVDGPLVCAYPEDLEATPESQGLRERGLLAEARCLTKNLLVVKSLLRSGTCAGVLPEILCGDFLGDRRFKVTPLAARREVWLLVQDHLRHDPATRAVIAWLRQCFSGLEGAGGAPR